MGVLALLTALLAYGLAISVWIAPGMARWPVMAQTAIYLALGLIWLPPLRRFMIWMETGRWR